MDEKNLKLAILGIILDIVGTFGAIYQIFGQMTLWIVLIIVGAILALFYLWKTINEWRVIVKTFGKRWCLDDGQLIIGNTVNVALRTKTVQELLNAFNRELGENGDIIIKKVGKNIGESFADDLKRELVQRGIKSIVKPGKDPKFLKEKLDLWAEYDSSTGMGTFKVEQVKITIDGLHGHILVKNSFLAHDMQSEIPTCTFIEGYLEGVMSRLLGIHILTREVECSAITSSEYCKFEIIQK